MKCLNCNNDFDNVNDSCPKCGYKINEKYLNYIQDKKVIENLAEYKNTNNNIFSTITAHSFHNTLALLLYLI